jgi:hypothetical protein
VALGLLIVPAPSSAAELPSPLGIGDATFWDGGYVASAQISDPSFCGSAGSCFTYPLRVTAKGGKVLRVAVDSEDESNNWQLQLIDPSGIVVAGDVTYQSGGLGERNDVELFARNPVPGTWTVRVIPANVVAGTFVARAALDWVAPPPVHCIVPALMGRTLAQSKRLLVSANCKLGAIRILRRGHWSRQRVVKQRPAAGTVTDGRVRVAVRPLRGRRAVARAAAAGVGDLLPDIAPDPPWHVTFSQPLPQVVTEGGNLTALGGLHNPVAQLGGQAVYACLPEESTEQGGTRCLRFSSGVASLGPGLFEVFGSAGVPVAVAGGPLMQVIHRTDGTTRTRAAGLFSFHRVHAHYHVLDLAEFPLLKVVGADHALVPVGRGLKEGFCLGNLKLYSWSTFTAAPVDPNTIDNCEPSADPSGIAQLAPDAWRFYEGIANGWEDVYMWATSGQFVDFGANPDGVYVLRMLINPAHKFLETDYANNAAYTEFQVAGNTVRVLERGRGTDPWDPHKIVLGPEFTRS